VAQYKEGVLVGASLGLRAQCLLPDVEVKVVGVNYDQQYWICLTSVKWFHLALYRRLAHCKEGDQEIFSWDLSFSAVFRLSKKKDIQL
jgi:hypothetical protein